MSTDYVCMAFAVPSSQQWKDAEKQMLSALNSLEITDLTDIDKTNIINGLDYGQKINLNSFQKAKSMFKEDINEFLQAISNNEDYGVFKFKEYDIYYTGGETYGDEPTESFEVFNRFSCLPKKIRDAINIEFEGG